MIRPWRSIALLVVLLTLAGCATGSSSGSGAPRVRCLSDPARDAAATSRPLFFLFCMESP
jgi:hypothetical protein